MNLEHFEKLLNKLPSDITSEESNFCNQTNNSIRDSLKEGEYWSDAKELSF